jgi:hypothetical protein
MIDIRDREGAQPETTLQDTSGYERAKAMTPALGLTVSHPDKADHGYTLFVALRGHFRGRGGVGVCQPPFFRTTSVLGAITLCSVPIATRRTSQGCEGKPSPCTRHTTQVRPAGHAAQEAREEARTERLSLCPGL